MNAIEIIIILAINILSIWSVTYFTRKARNSADKEDVKDIAEQSELGKNLATKKDIAEITEKIETIKNEISFENQRKHTFIEERTARFINILQLSEDLVASQAQLLYYLYDINSYEKLSILIDDINLNLKNIVHEGRMIMVSVDDEKVNNTIQQLIQSSIKYATYLCVTASNGLSHMSNRKSYFEIAEKQNNSELYKYAASSNEGLNKLREKYEDEVRDEWNAQYDNIIKYMALLQKLYGKEFHFKIEFPISSKDSANISKN